MNFLDLAKQRVSVRGYQDRPVEKEKLAYALEAARLAPTGGNRQAFQLVVIHTAGRTEEMQRIYGREWFAQAPVVICACAAADYALNIGIVMDHLILAATEQGLGSCWIGAFDRAAVREILGLPDGVEPVILATLGYAADEGRPKQRKPLEELVRPERW
jgi:nitroreductase